MLALQKEVAVAGVGERDPTRAGGGDGAGGVEGVDAAPHPARPSLLDLVGEGVGERLDGSGGGDGEAVVVEEGVEVWEGELAVATEEGEGGASQCPPRHRSGVGVERRQRGPADLRWAPALVVLDERPQPVAQVVDLGERRDALRHQPVQLVLVGVHHRQELVATKLQLEPSGVAQLRSTTAPVQAASGDREPRAARSVATSTVVAGW